MSRIEPQRHRTARTAIVLFLIIAVGVVFRGTLQNGFVSWDDRHYVTDNPHIRVEGGDDVAWVFTHSHYWSYIPLTMLSHAADVAVFGMDPFGHHLTSLILHAVNAVLFFLLAAWMARRWTGGVEARAILTGAIAAFIFALHPLRVESVAWVSDRKDLLCTFFLLLAMAAWLRSTGGGGRPRPGVWSIAALVFHGAAVLSKATALMFPVVIIVLALADAGREEFRERCSSAIRRAAPHFLLSVAAGIIGMASVPAVTVNFLVVDLSPVEQVLLPFHSVMQPLAKFVWPAALSPLYDYPPVTVMGISALLLVLITVAAAVVWRMGRRGPAAAWGVYLILSAPTAMFFASGIQPIADRYTYVSMLPLTLLLAAGVEEAGRVLPLRRPPAARTVAVMGVLCAVLAAWSARSIEQVRVWRDSLSLWQHAVRISPGTAYAQNNLGEALSQAGHLDEALVAYRIAGEMRPDFADAFNNLGVAYSLKGDYRRGIEALKRAEDLFRLGGDQDASIADVRFNLGVAYRKAGDTSAALESLRSALAVREVYAEAHAEIGSILLGAGDTLAAVRALRRAGELGDTAAARRAVEIRPGP